MSDTHSKTIVPTRTAEDMAELYAIFGDDPATIPRARVIRTPEMPEPFRGLLSHENHMTVTLERFQGAPVNVTALEVRRDGDAYSRKIVLTDSRTGGVVLFGIMRIRLGFCDETARERIVSESAPLGRILIEAGMLRRVGTHALLEIEPNDEMARALKLPAPRTLYGRLATIFCNDEPAVDLFEVVGPEGIATSPSASEAHQ